MHNTAPQGHHWTLTMAGNLLSDEAVAQVREVVLRVLGSPSGGRNDRPVPPVFGTELREGVLAGDLDAATSTLTGPSTATLTVYRGDGSGDLESAGSIEVTNRSPDLSAASGVYCIVARINGEWRPIWVDCSPTNEIQTITITGSPDGGTFILAFQGSTTSSIAYNASAATVQTALEALSSIGSGNVACTGGPLPGTPVDVEFQGSFADTNVGLMLATNSLTGGTDPEVTVTVDTEGCCG